jgi:hypothetical protein
VAYNRRQASLDFSGAGTDTPILPLELCPALAYRARSCP